MKTTTHSFVDYDEPSAYEIAEVLRELGTQIIMVALHDAQVLSKPKLTNTEVHRLYHADVDPISELEEFANEGIWGIAEIHGLELSPPQIAAISKRLRSLVSTAKTIRAQRPYRLITEDRRGRPKTAKVPVPFLRVVQVDLSLGEIPTRPRPLKVRRPRVVAMESGWQQEELALAA